MSLTTEGISTVAMCLGAATVVSASVASLYLWSRPEPSDAPTHLNRQSVEQQDGSRISPFLSDGALTENMYDGVRSACDLLKTGLNVSNNGPCLGTRSGPNKEYEWITYQEVYDRAQRVGSGLLQLGLKPSCGEFLAIYCINRPEWTITDLACAMFSIVSVPLYDTLGSTACSFVINQTELSTVVCENVKKAQKLLTEAEKTPSLKTVVVIDCKDIDSLRSGSVKIVPFSEVEKMGHENMKDPQPPKPSDTLTVCYTSGSTGDPKGVVLTHENIIAAITAISFAFKHFESVNPSDRYLSYLPLAHMYERTCQFLLLVNGVQIGFYQGDVQQMLDDMQTLKPTLFCTVPRVLNKLYTRVHSEVAGSWMKSKLLEWGLSSKEAELKRFIIRKDSIWDRLIFRRIQNLLGGKVRCVVTGSAPLSEKVLTFTRCALGCLVLEGYGQTEATAAITCTIPGDYTAGHVGGPCATNFVKLVDVPEMEYCAAEGKGEVCVKGRVVCKGYFKNPEKTAEIIDKDGWLHTGDIGMWLPNGSLKIIDRKKNIFKLAQGEYIAPERIENICQYSPFVSQVFIDGDSLKSCIMAVVVPEEAAVKKWASSEDIGGTFEQVCTEPAVKNHILEDIRKLGKKFHLNSFELVKDIFLQPHPFSIDDGLMTPTFKNKRYALKKHFKQQVDELYRKNGI